MSERLKGGGSWILSDNGHVTWAIRDVKYWKRYRGGWRSRYTPPYANEEWWIHFRHGYLYCHFVKEKCPTLKELKRHPSGFTAQELTPLYEHLLFNLKD